jgi:hypothetical protein
MKVSSTDAHDLLDRTSLLVAAGFKPGTASVSQLLITTPPSQHAVGIITGLLQQTSFPMLNSLIVEFFSRWLMRAGFNTFHAGLDASSVSLPSDLTRRLKTVTVRFVNVGKVHGASEFCEIFGHANLRSVLRVETERAKIVE